MEIVREPARRGFLTTAIYGLMAIISAALGLPAAAYLLIPSKKGKSDGWVDAGDLSGLSDKTPEEMVFRRNRTDGWKIVSEKTSAWVVKKSDKEVVAFAPSCTHLGCAYHWDEQKNNFLCPCHTSTFSLDGKPLEGPAPRALDRYEVKVQNNRVYLGKIIKSEEA